MACVAWALRPPRDYLALLSSPDVLAVVPTIGEIAATEEILRSLLEKVEVGVAYLTAVLAGGQERLGV